MKKNYKIRSTLVRSGCKDIWNAFMLKGASFKAFDIPFCPTTATHIPKKQITWEEAKQIHKTHISNKEYDYYEDSFVNWYLDDYKFDTINGIWYDYNSTLNILRHFAGIITPDFSTFLDFPYPIKIYATYRMRAFGYWLGTNGIEVINNVRWGNKETYKYCFEGIPINSIVSISTLGGNPRKLINRDRFVNGLYQMVNILKPNTILVYGSTNLKCFDILKKKGIHIISFQSKTARAYKKVKQDEQRQ